MSERSVGIDIEQFMRDPYATGIQRVLQYLAKEWPVNVRGTFVVPLPEVDNSFVLLEPPQAAQLLSMPFEFIGDRAHFKMAVDQWIIDHAHTVHTSEQLHKAFDAWLLPEVSYLPSVVSRFEDFRVHARTSMIGYDVLPMIEPANYRFPPGRAAWVSEYFRLLAVADAVACISQYSMRGIIDRLRRSESKTTIVAHPGGDHIPIRQGQPPERPTFIRVGTMEARKMPIEILEAFTQAVDAGLQADLIYAGTASASDERINSSINAAIETGYPVRWIQGASDAQIYDLIQQSTAFLSFGVEGYGIPVLEAIRLGTPVLYSGMQPAAELMKDKGACYVGHDGHLMQAFTLDLDLNNLVLDPSSVPTWKEFVHQVSQLTYAR